jgi:hypothetical protein
MEKADRTESSKSETVVPIWDTISGEVESLFGRVQHVHELAERLRHYLTGQSTSNDKDPAESEPSTSSFVEVIRLRLARIEHYMIEIEQELNNIKSG